MSSNCQSQSQSHSILLVGVAEPGGMQIAESLRDAGFQTTQTPRRNEAQQALASGQYAAVLIRQDAARDTLTAFCRTARAGNDQLVIIPALTGRDERLELELFGIGVDDVVADHHTPQAIAKRLAVHIAGRQRMN